MPGVYIARPVPFALLTGNIYELQDAGIAKGTLELSYARHLQTENAAYDDGWFGYGTFQAPPAAKKAAPLRASKTLPVIKSSADESSKPHLSNKSGDASTTGSDTDKTSSQTSSKTDSKTDASAPAADPDRPTMKRRTSDSDTSASSTQGSGSTPADDPDRPTMKRRTDSDTSAKSGSDTASTQTSTPADDPDRPTMKRRSSDSSSPDSNGTSSDSASANGSGNDPANDPDRPTLKRRSPEEAKKAQRAKDDVATVTGTGSLNDDPNRPKLQRGKPASAMTETDLPKLSGLPKDLHQMVAVSDAANRAPHEFVRPWEDAAEKEAILAKMQAMARTQLASYGGTTAAPPAVAAPPVAKKAPASRTRRAAAPAPAAPVPLLDEELKGYTLSYGGAATYVYTAHTAGTGADLRYVTVVAQADALGELKPAVQSVTDAAHLDRTPWMRFVDVVDVEASNRASLLFELRAQNSRQFALYRVIAARPEQIFLTGSTL